MEAACQKRRPCIEAGKDVKRKKTNYCPFCTRFVRDLCRAYFGVVVDALCCLRYLECGLGHFKV